MREKVKADSRRSYFKLLFRRETPGGLGGEKDVNQIKALAGWICAKEAAERLFRCLTLTVFEVQLLAVQSTATE